MGEIGRGFSLEFKKKSKSKTKLKKRKLLNIMALNFWYTNTMLLLVIRTIQTQSFTFYKKNFFGTFHS